MAQESNLGDPDIPGPKSIYVSLMELYVMIDGVILSVHSQFKASYTVI